MCGGIAGINSIGNIVNCYTTEDTIIIASNTVNGKAGGIVGWNHSAISGCYNLATVRSEAHAGGIVGISEHQGIVDRDKRKIQNCYNRGDIVSSGGCAGGIVGAGTDVEIYYCYNTGDVTGATFGGGISGGISPQNYTAIVKNTYNTGYIYASEDTSIVGGILGGTDAGEVEISNSYNEGRIAKAKYSGGIVGQLLSSASDGDPIVSKCYYKTGSADVAFDWAVMEDGAYASGDIAGSGEVTSSMPTILSIVNVGSAYTSDTKNINDGYPILRWQV